jgi:hypothetical protein
MHTHDSNLNDELRALESRLRGWAPAVAGVDRDRVLYEAGRFDGTQRLGLRGWKLATAALALVSLGLGLAWGVERGRTQALAVALESSRAGGAGPGASPVLSNREPGAPPVHDFKPLDPSSYLALTLSRAVLDDSPANGETTDRRGAPEPGGDSSLLLRFRGREASVLLDL